MAEFEAELGIWQHTVLLVTTCQKQFITVLFVVFETKELKSGCWQKMITLAKTMEITQSMEAADQNAQKLKGREPNL